MSHKYLESQTFAERPKSAAAPAASGYVCAVCGCLEDDSEHQQPVAQIDQEVPVKKRLKLRLKK